MEWLILSKAFDRSNSIKADSLLLSIASNKKSLIIILRVFVEWYLRLPGFDVYQGGSYVVNNC